MLDSAKLTLDSYHAYPSEQWRVAMAKFPAPSNRPPLRFWREQRASAIAWLAGYGIVAFEYQGIVRIGETIVDTSYVNY